MNELLLLIDTQRPSGVAVYAAWWKCWKPAPLDGQWGHIQWPPLLQVGPQALCLYRKMVFSKTATSLEISSCYSKNTPPVVPVQTLTLGKVTFINFHEKEPWSSASPPHWDPPPVCHTAFSVCPSGLIMPESCPDHVPVTVCRRLRSNKKMKESLCASQDVLQTVI